MKLACVLSMMLTAGPGDATGREQAVEANRPAVAPIPGLFVDDALWRVWQKDYEQRIDKLLRSAAREVTTDADEEPAFSAIFMLGRYRAKQAVPLLVERFTAQGYFSYSTKTFPHEHYPAAMALAEIGGPAIRPMMDKVFDIDSSWLEQKLAMCVLLEVEHRTGLYRDYWDVRLRETVAQRLRDYWPLFKPKPGRPTIPLDVGIQAIDYIEFLIPSHGEFENQPEILTRGVLPRATIAQEYELQIQAIPPAKFPNGELQFWCHDNPPRGLELHEDGKITGVPTKQGEFRFVIGVQTLSDPDSNGNRDKLRCWKEFRLRVD